MTSERIADGEVEGLRILEAVDIEKTLRDWYLSHLENNDDGSGLISTIAIRDATLNGLGVHLLISFMTRKLGFLLWQATSSMTE